MDEKEIAELEAQEPVAVIGNDYQLLYVGSGPLAPLVWKHGLKVGSKLYAAPVVSPDVEKLKAQIAELESLRAENTRLDAGWRDSNFCWFKAAKELETLRARLAELEELKASRGLRHVQQLQAELQSLKAELAKATHQVEISERDLAASVLEKMELVSELEAARKDADRYRWLCATSSVPSSKDCGLFWIEKEDADKHLDAAIEQKGGACKTCNGEGGWESAASSTSYFWTECPACVNTKGGVK